VARRKTRGGAGLRRMAARAGLALGLVAATVAIPALATQSEPLPDPRVVGQLHAQMSAPDLTGRLTGLGQGFDGRVGIAVRDLNEGWTASFDGDSLYPQQSVSKLWVAMAVLDAVDRGRVALADTITIHREDLSVFHQPIRARVGPKGYAASVGELLSDAISKSDNAANDVLLRLAGGRAAVQALVADKKVAGVTASPSQREMQTRTAGLDWRPEYSFEHTFWHDRDRQPLEYRRAALDEYLTHPADGASPNGLVTALDRLRHGELLAPASTDYMMRLMGQTETGRSRLKAGLPPGWSLAHKTGTGQVLGEVATGFNDVGVMTAPDGHAYAVAVMIAQTRASVPDRQALMVAVARAVAAHHDREAGDPAATALAAAP
jgi:beta-lactamase class A